MYDVPHVATSPEKIPHSRTYGSLSHIDVTLGWLLLHQSNFKNDDYRLNAD